MESRQLTGKIGIMGGTFNPIHNGHIALAKHAKEALKLHKILFIPTGKSYMKRNIPVLSGEVRLEMTRLAVCEEEGFEVSGIEVSREGNTYTYETLEQLSALHPKADFHYLIGADTLFSMEKWVSPEKIFALCTVMAVARDGSTMESLLEKAAQLKEKYEAKIVILPFEEVDISSSEIRKKRTHGETIDGMVPVATADYIYANGLYENEEYPMPYGQSFAEYIKEELKKQLSKHRYEHVLAVAEVSRELAKGAGCLPEKAYVAGLLHDCAKYMTDEELLEVCKTNNIPVSEAEAKNVQLLHAKVGAHLAKTKYGMRNEELLDAITYHTTGRPGMSALGKIVFVADFIEPGRKNLPRLEEKRQMARQDLEKAFFMILEDQLSYLNACGQVIDPMTQKTYDYYVTEGK